MLAKRSSRALALLLTLPSAAFAVGLGDIHLLSPLNAPLDAEIELVDVAPDEINSLQSTIASRDTFARYGLDWPAYLAGVQVRTVRTPDGREVIKLKSTEAISDPFITLLVEVNWARGRLVREYTMLLDPPVYAPGNASLASAAVAAPATGGGTREGAIARSAPTLARDSTPASSPATVSPAAAAAPETTAGPAPAPDASAATGEPSGESTHLVRPGETLSRIAAAAAGDKATTARGRSWMLAIYRANPRAFDKNMNVLRSGAVLRMPDAAQAAAVPSGEASAEIRRQYTAWRGEPGTAAGTAAGEQPGRLKLVTPSEGASAGAGAASGETAALQGRVHDLEGQLAESKRLLELKDADLARLQAQLAAKQGAQAAAPPPPQPEPAPAAAPPAAEQPPLAQAAPPPPPTAEEKLPAPAPEAAPPAKPAPAPKAAAPAPAGGGSIFDTLKDYWWAVLLALVALIAFGASRFLRARRASAFDDSLGRLAVAGADHAEAISPGRGFASGDVPVRPTPAAAPEGAFLVEESGTHERPRFTPGPAPSAPAAKHVATDDTVSSETAINLDQGDPLAEADFHMAYGLYDQAADLIRIAISREPTRRDLKLKLLEVFFVWGNKEQFLQTARELAESKADAAPGEWEKILIMGKQLAPEDPLFTGSAGVSGATAGGVDLDLEGGQSRVDFDLLGEPVPGEAAQGVDLDIGAAVGDRDPTMESTTNVTDRNALLENSFVGGNTGTTRQMTARVRQDGTGTAEMEGPTVEQPQLTRADNATVRQKLETALRQSAGTEQTAELAIDDLGLDVGQIDTVDQPGIAAASTSSPDTPTLVAGLDEHSRKVIEDAHGRGAGESGSTGAWQFDQTELEAALTQTSLAMQDVSATSRLKALSGHDVDVDVGDASGTHPAAAIPGEVDLDVGAATGSHPRNGGLDLDVGTATVPDTAFAATQRLSSEELALPDLEPVTMSEVGTKLDLARAYMDMGDPDGARNILEEVLNEGSAAQKQEAQRLMESLPG